MHPIYIMVDDMAKIKKRYLDFTAYIWRDHKELDSSYLQQCKEFLDKLPRDNPFQAASYKQQATSCKQQALDKSR
jgi:mRNA-degrading endonuclease RelE of RelBE toxin-antitoxin system